MSEIAEKYSSSVSLPAADPWEEFGSSAGRMIRGTLLKFVKGNWMVNKEKIPAGKELVAIMDLMTHGWIKWLGGTIADQNMGTVESGFKLPPRASLGDQDQSEWEIGLDGRPQDPWTETIYLVLKEPGQIADDSNLYTFTTSSDGGKRACFDLGRRYGLWRRQFTDEYPVVRLGASSYDNATYGEIKTPVLEVVRGEPKAVMTEGTRVARNSKKQ